MDDRDAAAGLGRPSMTDDACVDPVGSTPSAALPWHLLRAFLAGSAGLCLLALVGLQIAPGQLISDVFFLKQDLPCLALSALLLVFLAVTWPRRLRGFKDLTIFSRRPYLCLGVLLAWIVLAGAAGWPLIVHSYPLSMDEFWAAFDARIFSHGLLMAPVPSEWRPYAQALQPMWRLEVAGDRLWASTYLPLNAAARGLFSAARLESLASPAWAAMGVAATFLAARKLWPARPSAALVAALLLATSPQLLITAMTPYAMSALFAMNGIWLLLVLQRRAWAYAAASVVGFAACGVHQLIFHLLFAAPFVLDLWLQRRWRPALLLTAIYAAATIFWADYWGILLPVVGASPKPGDGVGVSNFVHRVIQLLQQLNPRGAFLMAENLVRFISWQNPLTVPLILVGGGLAIRAPGPLRNMLFGVLLTLGAMFVILPYQGHGWGYRYLHGLLAPLALLAVAGFEALSRCPGGVGGWNSGRALAITTAGALLVMLPWRCGQVFGFSSPYARSYTQIAERAADVVVVDTNGLWFGADLVRNDPFLSKGPKVMQLSELRQEQLLRLCQTYRVAVFDKRQGAAAGIQTFDEQRTPENARKLALLGSATCRRSELQTRANSPV